MAWFAVVASYSPLLWLVIDTTSKAYTHARSSHNGQLPQEKQPQHNSLCSFVRREWRYYYSLCFNASQLKTIDLKLFWVNGPIKQVMYLLLKWEKDLKLNGWIQKTFTDKKIYFKYGWCEKRAHYNNLNFKESFCNC